MWQYSGTGAATDPLGVETAGGAAVVAVGLRGCVMTRAGILSVTGSRYNSLGQWGGGGGEGGPRKACACGLGNLVDVDAYVDGCCT